MKRQARRGETGGGRPLIAVVGPSASGKSTLIAGLRAAGYPARHIAQEHSYVPDMWQRLCPPRWLIYLDVTFDAARQRRRMLNWGPEQMAEEQRRLAHARAHCDLYIDTSALSPADVLARALAFLLAQEGKR